jgi:hypothetical protein
MNTLAEATPVSEQLPTLLYEVVRHRGHWRVLHIGKHSPPFADQVAATAAAIGLAQRARTSGRFVAVRLLRTDGKVIEVDFDSGSTVGAAEKSHEPLAKDSDHGEA